MSDKVEAQYVAITGYEDSVPQFGDTVYAGDRVSAMTQFDLQDIFYIDVMPYTDPDQLYLFDDE